MTSMYTAWPVDILRFVRECEDEEDNRGAACSGDTQ